MPDIQLLSEETINQIAAGEVIESPASAVKELVENSIDAGAKKITIEISQGGLHLIRVIDDGSGMEREDALLSIRRHATSKMQHFKDLFRLTTMGFRGEALAAIGAISKLTITTSTENLGVKMEVEGGVLQKTSPAARIQGTTVEVREIFFNVPARKKFQKNPGVLSAEVFRLITQLALSAPSIHFVLISNKKTTLNALSYSSIKQRANWLIGSEFAEKSFPIEYREGEILLSGLLGTPMLAKSNRLGQYFFLNRRFVYCEMIHVAIREAYGTRLDEKRHPSYLLYLQLPPDLVDINVHPQKREVRLRDERVLKRRIQEAIAFAFKTPLLEQRDFERPYVSFSEAQPTFYEVPLIQSELAISRLEERIIGLFGPYLFLEGVSVNPNFDGVVLMNLSLARFRLFYDQLMEKKSGQEKQELLLPLTISCTPIEVAMLLTHLDVIESLGFSIRPSGKELFLVEAIPPFLPTTEVHFLLPQLCELLQNFIGKSDIENQRRSKLALITANLAKNKQSFTVEEARELIAKLRTSSDPNHSPQGHPIMVHLKLNEIQDLFSN